jgi:uncharacterized SAM-binding protein YcdF (DUF218 family)
MPPAHSRRRGRFLLTVFVVLIVVGAASLWAARSIGHVLHHEDPLERGDAIVVLGGSWLERVAEGGELYREGRAPLVMLSHELPDHGELALRGRGLPVPSVTEVQVQALTLMGVPRAAIEVMPPQSATADEARTISELARARQWRTIIVVTHKLHTARARMTINRRLNDANVRILMRATRYDPADIDRWWRSRSDSRFALFEAQKMFAYWLGLAD